MSPFDFFKYFFTRPNSAGGLILRAERLEGCAEKLDGEDREKQLLYARVLRELAAKNLSLYENRAFIAKELRGRV